MNYLASRFATTVVWSSVMVAALSLSILTKRGGSQKRPTAPLIEMQGNVERRAGNCLNIFRALQRFVEYINLTLRAVLEIV